MFIMSRNLSLDDEVHRRSSSLRRISFSVTCLRSPHVAYLYIRLTRNLTGTGLVAQIGAVTLLAIIWASVLTNDIILFSYHPLAQSLAIFLLVESILSL